MYFFFRFHQEAPEHHNVGVLPPPNDHNSPGEMGKPVIIENPSPKVKAQIDAGWKRNSYNQVLVKTFCRIF